MKQNSCTLLNEQNPKAYWKHVVVHKPKEKECVTLACFKEHFKEICSSAEQQVISIDHNYKVFDPILDRNFTTQEIGKGIKQTPETWKVTRR